MSRRGRRLGGEVEKKENMGSAPVLLLFRPPNNLGMGRLTFLLVKVDVNP